MTCTAAIGKHDLVTTWLSTLTAPKRLVATFGSHANVKSVFVVDPDFDIFSDEQIEWALDAPVSLKTARV